jgi:cysteinyl-tRNA synthetase
MNEDADALGVLRPIRTARHRVRAADARHDRHAREERLRLRQAARRDVCYSVRKFPGYGKLSGKSLDDLRAGERVEVDSAKHDPLDFVLWKHAKGGARRSQVDIALGQWPPRLAHRMFGHEFATAREAFRHPRRRTGSAVSASRERDRPVRRRAHLPFVNYWMHNGFVRVDDEKMSKSLGNFFTIREVLKKYDAEVVRFFILRAHYRSPLNYSDVHLDDARHALTRLYTALKDCRPARRRSIGSEAHAQRFKTAMDDDFGTPEAVAVLFDLATVVNRGDVALALQLKALGGVLGLLQRDPQIFLQAAPAGGLSNEEIDAKVGARTAAKKAKNFAESDRLRDELKAAGIVLEDGPQGTTWRRA